MRFLFTLTALFYFITINVQAESYIDTKGEASVSLLKDGVTFYQGIPVQIVSQEGEEVTIEITGYVAEQDKTKLFATTNLSLLLASVDDGKNLIQISGNKGNLILSVPKDILTDDIDEAWEENSDLFYDSCTKCHYSKVIESHTMLEWEAVFESMKELTGTSANQNKLIIRFLKAFAKDGILRESE